MSTTTTTITKTDNLELRQVSFRRGHTTAFENNHNKNINNDSNESIQHRHGHSFQEGEGPEGEDYEIGDIYYNDNDPLLLKTSKKTEDDLKLLKQKGSSKKVRQFYRDQNDLIDSILSPLTPINDDEQEKQLLKLKIAIYGSVLANILLFGLQLVAAITSGSLSIFATMADAFMDLLSSMVLMGAAKLATKVDVTKYPAGRARTETVGIIVFSCLMGCLALFLIIESAQKLGSSGGEPNLNGLSIAMVATALGVKLILFVYCVTLSQHQTAKVLAQDHQNDLMVNSLGLITGIVGTKIASWVDPVGCIIIALIILQSWIRTLWENVQLVVGKSASVGFLQRVTYIALTHPGVVQVDTCIAYYSGNNLLVEVDIVLPPDMPLLESHDIGESLQMKLEDLPNVERAFVHVDYETSHKPEHQKSK
ncbi:cation efflux family-domain-containing protein [Cunninghamella echinulata]|nr:cation efflux family-domain-containing protein [Cunninghamella echinulata]